MLLEKLRLAMLKWDFAQTPAAQAAGVGHCPRCRIRDTCGLRFFSSYYNAVMCTNNLVD